VRHVLRLYGGVHHHGGKLGKLLQRLGLCDDRKAFLIPLRQPHAGVGHVDDLIEPGLEKIALARLPPLPWLHPRPRQKNDMKRYSATGLPGTAS
jgi:hypothetical protein